MPYQITIYTPEELHDKLVVQDLGIVVDPVVFRLGQLFLQGPRENETDKDMRWGTIARDVGSIATFFDLVVLHDQLPAFNYMDTYQSLDENLVGDSLGLEALLNTCGDQTLVHVDMEHDVYYQIKKAAIEQLRKRMTGGPFVPRLIAEEILQTLTAIQYQWEPSLWDLGPQLSVNQQRLARFLVGQLVFSGYAQEMGSAHVVSPRDSHLLLAFGLQSLREVPTDESAIYTELHRRFRTAGPGWRDDELPWTPSFLPYLLTRMRYREGPDVLLQRAKELRSSKAIDRYRKLRSSLIAEDGDRSAEARKELTAAADGVARSLDSDQQELQWFKHFVVEVLPRAVGVVAGGLVGGVVAGPPGTIVGGLAGLVGEESLRPVQNRLWGWVLDEIPFRSARKLLARAVIAERQIEGKFASQLQAVWETPRLTT